jgi:protein MpaA
MQMRFSAPAAWSITAALVLAACSNDSGSNAVSTGAEGSAQIVSTSIEPTPVNPTSSSQAPSSAVSTIASVTPTVAPTTVAPTTIEPTTIEPTTVAPTTTDRAVVETRTIGESVEGRAIVAERRGTPGGRVVLIIGVIHGDEHDGLAIMQQLRQMDVPAGVDLWLVDSMNPDGVADNTRHNANQVDLNRNFPDNWGPIGVPGDGQYAGPSAASEPETQAMVDFIATIRPDLTMWYHQDLYRIAPGRGRDGRIRQRYADLTGLPVVGITGGTYTGVAATWARNLLNPGVAFIVELGPSVTAAEAQMHAEAVLTVAGEDIE